MPRPRPKPVALGTKALDFGLPDASGNLHTPSDYSDAPTVLVAFISNRCPFVIGIPSELGAFAQSNAERGLQIIAINSDDAVAHPEEALAA